MASCKVRLYADDCVVYHCIRSVSDHEYLQHNLDSIMHWSVRWRMSLNPSKCQCVSFTRKHDPYLFGYTLDSVQLTRATDYKYLGVHFSSNLTWTKHVEYVTAKSCKMLNFVKGNFRLAPPKIRELLYFSNVRPMLEYACVAWDPQSKSLCNMLELVQNRAARFVSSNYDFTFSVTAIKDRLGWELLSTRRKNIRLEMLFKIFHGLVKIDKESYI